MEAVEEGAVDFADFLWVFAAVAFDGGLEGGAVGSEEDAAEGLPFGALSFDAVDEALAPEVFDEVVEHVAAGEPADPGLWRAALVVVQHQAESAAECVLLGGVVGDDAAAGEGGDAAAELVGMHSPTLAEPHKMARRLGWQGYAGGHC